MAWEKIHNSEPNNIERDFLGKCPRFHEEAAITIKAAGIKECKNDLKKIYHRASFECSLLKGTNEESFSPCMKNCSIVPKEYLHYFTI